MQLTVEKRAGRQYDCPRLYSEPHLRHDARGALPFEQHILDALLQQREPRLGIEKRAYGLTVEDAVGLRARCANGRPFARVQRSEMYAGPVDGTGHDAAERVDLAREMPLADPADRRVTAHVTERVEILCEQQGTRPATGSSQRRLGAGVAATDDDAIEI